MLHLDKIKEYYITKNASRKNNFIDYTTGVGFYNDSISLYEAILVVINSYNNTWPGVSDGDKGDIIVSNTGLDWKIDQKGATLDQVLSWNGTTWTPRTVAGSVGTGVTNLTFTTSPTQGTVNSDTGTDAVIPAGSTVVASLMLPGDKTKLNYIIVSSAVNLDTVVSSITDISALTGATVASQNLGTFTGTTISDNVTIKSALQELETAIESYEGNSENGISGTGSLVSKFKLGGVLTENTSITGAFTKSFNLTDMLNIVLATNANTATTTAKSTLSLSSSLIAGASLKAEVNGDSTRFSEVRVDADGTLTSLYMRNGTTKAGVYMPSEAQVHLESTNGSLSGKVIVNSLGHFFENLNTGATTKSLYIDDVTGEVLKGDAAIGGSSTHSYDAGNGAIVKATGTGITFTKAAGVGTFTAPIGVTLLSARINGVSADLAGDSSFSIICPTTSLDDFPNVTKINRVTGATPTGTVPYQYDLDNAPMIQITDSTSTSVKVRVINLNTYSYWALKLNF